MRRIDGDRLRHERLRAGLTQRQLADAAGVDSSTIWNYENGYYSHAQDLKLYAIAEQLKIDPEILLSPPRLRKRAS